MPAGVQRIEIGDAVNAEHNRFAIERKLPMPVLQCCLDDPGIPIGPVVSAARDQAHAVAVALQAEAIAVVFYSCSQSGPAGALVDLVRRQKSKDLNIWPR